MQEKIEIVKNKNVSEKQVLPKPPGALLIENTKILKDTEERKRLLKEREDEIAKKIEKLFEMSSEE